MGKCFNVQCEEPQEAGWLSSGWLQNKKPDDSTSSPQNVEPIFHLRTQPALKEKKSRMTQTTGIRELTVATGRCSRPRRVAAVARTEAKCSVIVRAAGTGVRNSVGNSI